MRLNVARLKAPPPPPPPPQGQALCHSKSRRSTVAVGRSGVGSGGRGGESGGGGGGVLIGIRDEERSFGRGLGGTALALSSRGRAGKEEGRKEEMREGCVAAAAAAAVVDFAIGAFNIKPRAINGQASERGRELAGRRRRRKARVRTEGATEWSVSGNHVGCGRTDICTFTSCDRASDK